jgi:DNA-binding response OmpR family regulator
MFNWAKRILVVDDDIIICKLLTTYLHQHGFECHSVHSGEDALEVLAETQFHSVITDLKMEGISGQAVIRRVKSAHPDTKVVMITGSCDETDKKEAFQNGVDDFFYKPFSMKAILNSLQHSSSP